MKMEKVDNQGPQKQAERMRRLTETAKDTTMGKVLRQFWHPIALSKSVAPGTAKRVRLLSEDLTLYRGESGTVHLVGARCAHRGTLLHTGWIEGDQVRCMYHGWKYDGNGQCTERPAERAGTEGHVRIPAYPVREYCGVIFTYMGEGRHPISTFPAGCSASKKAFSCCSAKKYGRATGSRSRKTPWMRCT